MTRQLSQAAYKRVLYQTRLATRKCTDCGAGLQENDKTLCVECREAASLRERINYDTTRNRAHNRRYADKHHDQIIAKQRARRLDKKARGECIDCPRPCNGTTIFCDKHARDRRKRNNGTYRKRGRRRYTRAQRAKLRQKWRQQLRQLRGLPPKSMVRIPEDWAKLLGSLGHMDWPDVGELFDFMDVPDFIGDPRERNRWTQLLSRAVKLGWARRRGNKGGYDYSLTQRGRRVLSNMRVLCR